MERAEATDISQESDTFDENMDHKPVTPSPNQSPGKTVRIKENGAKPNGDTEVRF